MTEQALPVCAKCGMEPVTLVLSDVPFDTDADLQMAYFCGWACLKLLVHEQMKLMPKHGRVPEKLPTPGRRKNRA